jgi:alpha-galactosidase
LQPSKTYFPNGLQPIIDRCHQLGLKFGIHIMRGIPRQSLAQNVPIQGTPYHAKDIVNKNDTCVWCLQNYGVDMSKPGAQEFYNNWIKQLADWGVDFLKVDDIVPFPSEVEAVTTAIKNSGRAIVLSLSPGGKVDVNALSFFKKSNMLRVTQDIWDDQEGIDACFKAWRKWQGKEDRNFHIDMDMIPFGELQLMNPLPKGLSGKETKEEIADRKKNGELSTIELLAGKGWNRPSELTNNQKYTFITMRALAASPLMVGGDLVSMDQFSLSLITNEEMIACNQNAVMGKLCYDKDKIEVWNTPKKNTQDGWIGVFNRNKNQELIWNSKVLTMNNNIIIPANGVVFIKYNKKR